MLVVCMVDCAMSLRTDRLSACLKLASAIAPTAPTPAASVGVAAPKIMDPKTTVISPSGGAIAPRTVVPGVAAASLGAGLFDGLRQPTNKR